MAKRRRLREGAKNEEGGREGGEETRRGMRRGAGRGRLGDLTSQREAGRSTRGRRP